MVGLVEWNVPGSKIDAPNLMSFTFCDWLPEDFVVDSFPLLHDADICFEGDIENRSGPLSKFIEKFCYVKLLKISDSQARKGSVYKLPYLW